MKGHAMTRFKIFAILSAGLLAAAVPLLSATPSAARTGQTASALRRTIWVQTMDSCRHALHGAYQAIHLSGGHSFVIGPGPGTQPVGVGYGSCPAPRGNCDVTSTGCVSFTVPVPSTAKGHPVTYTISQNAHDAAPNTVPCNGGSACRWERGFFTVYPSGAVEARVTNVYPDGTYAWYPSTTGYAATTRADP